MRPLRPQARLAVCPPGRDLKSVKSGTVAIKHHGKAMFWQPVMALLFQKLVLSLSWVIGFEPRAQQQ